VPSSDPVLQVQLASATPEWLHLPDTGTRLFWEALIRTGTVGQIEICGLDTLQAQTGASVMNAEASTGSLAPGWTSLPDSAAFGGFSVKLAKGTMPSPYTNDLFGRNAAVRLGTYDAWYRVRVTDPRGRKAEMKLGVFDTTSWNWLGSRTYFAGQLSTVYGWVQAGSDISPPANHHLQFLAEFS